MKKIKCKLGGVCFIFETKKDYQKAIKVYNTIDAKYCYNIDAVKQIFNCSKVKFEVIE